VEWVGMVELGVLAKAHGDVAGEIRIQMDSELDYGVDNGLEDSDHLFADLSGDEKGAQIWFGSEEDVQELIEELEAMCEQLE